MTKFIGPSTLFFVSLYWSCSSSIHSIKTRTSCDDML